MTGRPTDYTDDMCDKVIELGREGASKAEMSFALGIARSTFALWEQKHPAFSEAVKEACDLAQGWWEHNGRKATFGGVPNFNSTAFIFTMKNRFKEDWRDKVETEHSGSVEVSQITRKIIDPNGTGD